MIHDTTKQNQFIEKLNAKIRELHAEIMEMNKRQFARNEERLYDDRHRVLEFHKELTRTLEAKIERAKEKLIVFADDLKPDPCHLDLMEIVMELTE